jgi:hypothetical protein
MRSALVRRLRTFVGRAGFEAGQKATRKHRAGVFLVLVSPIVGDHEDFPVY